MAETTLRITVNDEKLKELLAKAPEAVTVRIRELIEVGAVDVQREMRVAAPIAVTGQLRGSVRYTVSPSQLQAEISPQASYAQPVEEGSRPHYVSVAPGTPLRAWAKQKGINPYALKHSIATKGTKAHPFVGPTYEKMKPVVERQISEGMTELVEELNRG